MVAVRAEVRTVTPTEASVWMGRRARNRKLGLAHVKWLAEQIERGKWGLNGQPIILDTSGRVIDGQHRLEAVCRAKRAIETVVVEGVEPSQFATIDTGRDRKAAHVLQIEGVPNPFQVAAALRLLTNYREERYTGTAAKVPNERILQLWRTNQGILDAVREAWRQVKKGWKVSVMAFARYYTLESKPSWSEAFFGPIFAPNEYVLEPQAAVLERWVLQCKEDLLKLTIPQFLFAVITAWNAYADGRPLKASELIWRSQGGGDLPRFQFRAKSSQGAA